MPQTAFQNMAFWLPIRDLLHAQRTHIGALKATFFKCADCKAVIDDIRNEPLTYMMFLKSTFQSAWLFILQSEALNVKYLLLCKIFTRKRVF